MAHSSWILNVTTASGVGIGVCFDHHPRPPSLASRNIVKLSVELSEEIDRVGTAGIWNKYALEGSGKGLWREQPAMRRFVLVRVSYQYTLFHCHSGMESTSPNYPPPHHHLSWPSVDMDFLLRPLRKLKHRLTGSRRETARIQVGKTGLTDSVPQPVNRVVAGGERDREERGSGAREGSSPWKDLSPLSDELVLSPGSRRRGSDRRGRRDGGVERRKGGQWDLDLDIEVVVESRPSQGGRGDRGGQGDRGGLGANGIDQHRGQSSPVPYPSRPALRAGKSDGCM